MAKSRDDFQELPTGGNQLYGRSIWLAGFLCSSSAWLVSCPSQRKLQKPRASCRLCPFHFLRTSCRRQFRFHIFWLAPSAVMAVIRRSETVGLLSGFPPLGGTKRPLRIGWLF